MSDWAENVARADAHRLPPSDYGSTRAIQNVAALLRAAYQRGRDEVEVHDCAPLRASLAAATAREGRLREALKQADAAMEALHPGTAGDMSDGDYARLWNATRDALGAALQDPAP
jgi:hypothetical protein